jgi:FO synthase
VHQRLLEILVPKLAQLLSWARHLMAVRDLQAETGGFTEFVPSPFVHMEAPMYLKGAAGRGPFWKRSRRSAAGAALPRHEYSDVLRQDAA